MLRAVCRVYVRRYEGDWQAALYEGHGSETFAKGSTYHGQYSAGLRHGWGVCRFFNGDYYEGQWSKGLRDGCGMQQVGQDSRATAASPSGVAASIHVGSSLRC